MKRVRPRDKFLFILRTHLDCVKEGQIPSDIPFSLQDPVSTRIDPDVLEFLTEGLVKYVLLESDRGWWILQIPLAEVERIVKKSKKP